LLHELEGEVDVVRHTFATVATNAKLGFYRNKRSGRLYGASPHPVVAETVVYLTAVKGPRRTLERRELAEKYESVERAEARACWNEEYARTPPSEQRRFHLLSGTVFPIYDKIMGSAGIQSVKIARAILADGQALVGLNLSPTDVPGVKQRLGIGTPLGEASAEAILGLLIGGAIELDSGWRLTTATISGDEVVELVLNGVGAHRDELLGYGLAEEIIHYKRRWFVTLDEAGSVLPELLKRRRPIRDLTVADSSAAVEVADVP
jgi:hypothetical protein